MRHEEFYVESRKYFDGLVIRFSTYRKVLGGKITLNQALDSEIKMGKLGDFDHYRVAMIVYFYFKGLRETLDEVMVVRDELNEIVENYKQQYKTGYVDGSIWIERFQQLLESFDLKAKQFETQVASYVTDAYDIRKIGEK